MSSRIKPTTGAGLGRWGVPPAVAPRLYQIGPSPDALINWVFEGLTEPRLTGLSCLFMGRSAVHAATSRLDVNTGSARVLLPAEHASWPLRFSIGICVKSLRKHTFTILYHDVGDPGVKQKVSFYLKCTMLFHVRAFVSLQDYFHSESTS